MIVSVAAFILDCLIGDPRSKFHPVVLIGNLIAWLEKRFYRAEDSNMTKFSMGFLLMLLVLLISYDVAWGVVTAAAGESWLSYGVQALLLSFTISPRSLAAAGKEIQQYLWADDLAEARKKVGWIVGRDTQSLDASEVTRATVETIAENIVDGIIAPFFFFFLGGVPLAVAYRAANTMDSMIGYKNDKYLYFGRAAARLDDVLNYIPARITGILLVLAAGILRLDMKNAWRIMRRDAAQHPSPNGGFPEAATAGALGIRLGGMNSYFGKPHFRAYMGDPLETLAAPHITGAIRLMYTATVLFLLVAGVLSLGGGR
jgi:adenosylcobinamide-phosphate synthase